MGWSRAAFSTASSPLLASLHVDVLLVGEQHAKAGADHRLVVDDGPPMTSEHGRRWKASAEDEPALGGLTCGHLAAVDLDAFADTDETVPEAVALRAPRAVVPYLNLQLVRPIANGHVRVAGMRVLECIRQAFLDDAVDGEVNPPRERDGLAVHMKFHGQSGTADLAQQ